MNWDAIGAVAEALGAIGVISTLLYLIKQINQSTATMRSTAVSAYAQASMTIGNMLAQDAELNRIFWACIEDDGSLASEEIRRAHAAISIYIQGMEQAHDLYLEEALSEEKWAGRYWQLKWIVAQPGFKPYWDLYRDSYTKSFSELVDGALFEMLKEGKAASVAP